MFYFLLVLIGINLLLLFDLFGLLIIGISLIILFLFD